MAAFEFATAGRILFGSGTSSQVGPVAAGLGGRALLVTDGSEKRSRPFAERLEQAGLLVIGFSVQTEPTIGEVLSGTQAAREFECDVVVGVGGGSVIDTGKAVAALITNGGEPLDYLEVIGQGKPLTEAPAPCIAVPTTAGTGAEVTRNAVLASPEHGVKVSMRSPLVLPRVAIVDPVLTHTMPPSITASTGLDALTQLLEAFVSLKANPLTDGICREGLQRSRSLPRAYENGADAEAREDMALASLFGGLALANAKLGAVHGFAGPMGGTLSAPHGVICARLLPHVVEANVRALKSRAPESPVLNRFAEVAQILTGSPSATASEGVKFIHDLCGALKIPPLSDYGLREDRFPTLVEKARKASSMKGNPIELTPQELTEILHRSMQ